MGADVVGAAPCGGLRVLTEGVIMPPTHPGIRTGASRCSGWSLDLLCARLSENRGLFPVPVAPLRAVPRRGVSPMPFGSKFPVS